MTFIRVLATFSSRFFCTFELTTPLNLVHFTNLIRVVGTTKTTPNRGPLLLGKLWFPKSLAVMV